jgi:large subunit ribosomal protein L18
MGKIDRKLRSRNRRRISIRKKIKGSAESPRLAVFRSNRHIYCQLINDAEGRTLAAASSKSREIEERRGELKDKTAVAREVGKLISAKASAVGCDKVVFDRGGFRYHGRVKALAEGAREGGLTF